MTYANKLQAATITLGFSPCPNDTFIFDAMVHHKVDTEGLEFKTQLLDVETLNLKAMNGELDVTKLSFAAFAYASLHYQLLNAGGALGKGVGPLVVYNPGLHAFNQELPLSWKIGIPGRYTTANFLFSLFFPGSLNKKEMIFSHLENAVLSGEVDAGVIIHENRFTYESKGLKKICDLGERWEKQMHLPVPLGGIAVRRDLPEEVMMKIDRVIRRSIEFAFKDPGSSGEYVKMHAQEMDATVRQKHIETYVNDFSVDYGEAGKKAIRVLFDKAKDNGVIGSIPTELFVKQASVTA